MVSELLTGAASVSPWGMIGGAALGGLGSYFGGQAQQQAAEEAAKAQREQLAFQKQQYADTLRSKQLGSGIIQDRFNTAGYGSNLNYANPYESAMNTSLNTFLSGGLMPVEQTQQAKDIATGQQAINAAAATAGLPAGARLGLQGQNVANVTGNYANMASGRIGQGIGYANQAANTGANIAQMNYQSGLQNFLNQQEQQNKQAQLLAGLA